MGRIVAIDYGRKRIGLAISDENQSLGLPFKTVEGGKKALENILKCLEGYTISTFVIGLPLNLNGTASTMSQEVEVFAKQLRERSQLPVETIDERLSSKQAETLHSTSSRKKRTKKLDTTAALLLLQTFLEKRA